MENMGMFELVPFSLDGRFQETNLPLSNIPTGYKQYVVVRQIATGRLLG